MRNFYLALAFAFGLAAPAQGSDRLRPVDPALEHTVVEDWFQHLAMLGQASWLEPAGSHGSTGLSIGAGLALHKVPASALAQSELGYADPTARTSAPVSSLHIVKGLPWPIDLGFTGSRLGQDGYTQASGHLQWTVYEALAMPALAVRGSFGRVFGLPASQLRREAIELVGSYSFLRYLTVFGAAGTTHHQAVLVARPNSDTGYLLNAGGDDDVRFEDSWWQTTRSIGLRVIALPPFIAITAESTLSGPSGPSYAAKISVGI